MYNSNVQYMEDKTPVRLIAGKQRHHKQITPAQEKELETLFFMDGITAYRASKIVGVSRETATKYFEMWSADLITDEGYETWAQRQKRVRARALEGIAKRIIELSTRRHTLERIYGNFIYKKGKEEELELKNMNLIPHELVLNYETRLLSLDRHLAELQAEYDSIEAKPPAEIILRQELLAMLDELETKL